MNNDHKTIECRDRLTYKEFIEEFEKPGKPVAVKGLMDEWEASGLWGFDFFQRHYGHIKVTARHSGDYEQKEELRLDEYLKKIEDGITDYYLKDWIYEYDIPELRKHYNIPLNCFSLTERFPNFIRPKWRWIFIGPKSSASHLHVDFLMSCAWNALFAGSKRWLIYPPSQARYMHKGAVNAFEPDLSQFASFANAEGYSYLQKPGEIIFMPPGWWHAVRNEETSISLSENFINSTNLRNYLNLKFVATFFRYADHPFWTK